MAGVSMAAFQLKFRKFESTADGRDAISFPCHGTKIIRKNLSTENTDLH